MFACLGVQSVYEDVALDTNRGHTVKAVCETFNLAKDAGFKVVAHMMPDLPNVDLERDIEQFMVRFRQQTAAVPPQLNTCFSGIFRKSLLQSRRVEDLPDFGDSWHRPLRALEDRSLRELSSFSFGGFDRQNPGFGAPVDPSLSRAARYSHAAS